MRVLVAEDDVVALTRLQRMLRGFGHEVEAVRDGLAAGKCLEKSVGGSVAILNKNLPGKGGIELASELRSRIRLHYTYIILLAPHGDPGGALTALEAGADAFLGIPLSAAALAAQLKAAERILRHEDRSHETTSKPQELLPARRPNQQPDIGLAGASRAQPSRPEQAPVQIKAPVSAALPDQPVFPKVPAPPEESTPRHAARAPEIPRPAASGPEPPKPELLSRVQTCFGTVLKRIPYTDEQAGDSISREHSDLTVYSALILEEQRWWFDLKMEMPRRVAIALYRALLSETPPSDAELSDALEEVCNMCRGAWKTDLENSGLEPITPGWPLAKRTREIPHQSQAKPLSSTSFALPGPIQVTLLAHAATVVDKPLDAVSPGDILADPINAAGRKLELLKRGTMLSARYIARIHDLLNPRPGEGFKLHVIEPSPLALFMRRRWPRKALDSSLTITVKIHSKEKPLQGRILDISENGLGASIIGTLNLGQTVTLNFSLGGDAEFRLEAVVRHRQASRCGFEFLSIPSQSAHKLKEAVRVLTA